MTDPPIYITRPLLSVLLEIAADADPNPANVLLVTTAAADLEPANPERGSNETGSDRVETIALDELDAETPVFSDFYFPDVGKALNFVFGVDLGTPAAQTQGRFLSHPKGSPELSVRDDLHATLVVATPPWRPANVSVYDRDSTPRDLVLVAAEAPTHDFTG